MGSTLVIGSSDQGVLTQASLEAASLGLALNERPVLPIGALFGFEQHQAAAQLSTAGFEEVLLIEDERLANYTADGYVAAAEELIRVSGATTVIVVADADSLEWAPRVAARLGAALVPGCLSARRDGREIEVKRAIAGGSLHANYRVKESDPLVLMISPGTFQRQTLHSAGKITPVVLPQYRSTCELLETISQTNSEGPPLKTAKLVIAGGVGAGKAAHWKLLEAAAAELGAAVGASRAAVEMGLAPASRQVGFSGLKVAPELYIAVGISGALHHLVGIGGARRVVAINSDPGAPIFKASHLGVVGDLAEILPAFTARLQELKGSGSPPRGSGVTQLAESGNG